MLAPNFGCPSAACASLSSKSRELNRPTLTDLEIAAAPGSESQTRTDWQLRTRRVHTRNSRFASGKRRVSQERPGAGSQAQKDRGHFRIPHQPIHHLCVQRIHVVGCEIVRVRLCSITLLVVQTVPVPTRASLWRECDKTHLKSSQSISLLVFARLCQYQCPKRGSKWDLVSN